MGRVQSGVTHPHVAQAARYVAEVLSGETPACKWVRLACQRHRDDLARAREGWRYQFDASAAEWVCRFIERFPHVKGRWAVGKRGNPSSRLIRLEPWQCFIIATLYGWVLTEPNEDGKHLRRFRLAYIAIPRKNGKSSLLATLCLYHLAADGEPGAEVFCGATSKDQAFEVFRPARQMAMAASSDGFRATLGVEVAAESIFRPEDGSFFKPLIGKPGDGTSPSFYSCDEFHEHRDDSQYDTMRTGMGAREQPLTVVITTAGVDLASPCHQLQQDVQKILEGTITDNAAEETFGAIWTIDEGDDWTTDDALRKANPNYGVSVFPDQLQSLRDEAVRSPRKQNIFKTKRLNVWVHARDPWMNMELWNRSADAPPEVEFAGERCWMAMDLSSKIDLTATIRLYRRETPEPCASCGTVGTITDADGETVPCVRCHGTGMSRTKDYYVYARHYLPEARAQMSEFPHYQGWAIEGHLQTTEGDAIDYARIQEDMLADAARVEVACLAYDPWNAAATAQAFQAEGLPIVEVPQTVRNLSEPMKELEALVLSGHLHHSGDPVLTWAVSNVTAKEDAKGNLFPRKESSESKIDPAVAMITAMSRAMLDQSGPKESVYEKRGARVL